MGKTRRLMMVEAPAKINLFLAVKSRRPDGYHNIESFMQKLSLVDDVHLGIAKEGIRLACPDSNLPQDADNLAYRAARLFLDTCGLDAGVEIVLHKRIPVAAGLGGGSSDAAAVLLGLDELFGTRMGRQKMMSLGQTIGADVPFFLSGYDAAWVAGIGDCLSEAEPLVDHWVVLVNPGFPVSTKWVYENFALTTGGNTFILAPGKNVGEKAVCRQAGSHFELFNDLESVTLERYPEIGAIKRALARQGAVGALMSGSGPTVFGLFADKGKAVHSFQTLSERYGKSVFLTLPYQTVLA